MRCFDGTTSGQSLLMTNSPSDNTTLAAVLAGYERSGFDSSFSPSNNGTVECVNCGSVMSSSQFTIDSLRRLEGASDPDDMIAVVALSCPNCRAKGLLVLGYGPMASAEDSDILATMKDGRGDASLPPNASPSDAAADPSESSAMDAADVANGEGADR